MKILLNIVVLLTLVTAGCVSPTPMQSSWSEPAYPPKDTTKRFQKILMVALLKDDAVRRLAEDKLVNEVRDRGVQSYKYFTSFDYQSGETMLNEKLQRDGFDGMVIMRLAAEDKSANYSTGNYPNFYNSWYGFYSTSFPRYNDPGYFSPNSVYQVETNVYSLKENKLIWTGITTAVNTRDTNRMIDGIIAAVKDKMKKQGLIK